MLGRAANGLVAGHFLEAAFTSYWIAGGRRGKFAWHDCW